MKQIIHHANTEAKYENIFKAIEKEWDNSTLKVVPIQEQPDDFVLTNTELMSEAIEENLSTLDTIAKSDFAAHVSDQIQDLKDKLLLMHDHLQVLTQAQKYWITLDPIYNSGLFKNFFGEDSTKFINTRQEFRRIMWSTYRHPKTTYNLCIKDRLPVYHTLINFYANLQKKVNDFLEQKRLQFTRFYFLNDSQFLDLMMRVSTHKDFNIYVNLLFSGA